MLFEITLEMCHPSRPRDTRALGDTRAFDKDAGADGMTDMSSIWTT